MKSLETLLNDTTDVETIKNILRLCNKIYYTGRPHMYNGKSYELNDLPSDAIYDSYIARYLPDEKNKWQQQGDTTEQIKHEFAMGTLAKFNALSISKLLERLKKVNKLLIMGKLDGNSLRCTFQDGNLILAVTRYNDNYGRNVTEKARCFVVSPDVKKAAGRMIINGEIMAIGDDYKKLGYANRRSAVSGIMNNDFDKFKPLAKYLTFMPYTMIEPNGDYIDNLRILESLGYKVPPYEVYDKDSTIEPKSLSNIYNEFVQKTDDAVDMDGLVICPTDGRFENTETPLQMVAYKLQAPDMLTDVINIIPSTTRTGRIVPRIQIQEVIIDGEKINFITGNNYNWLRKMRITRFVKIHVAFANDVLPAVISVEDHNQPPIENPTKCPTCSKELRSEGESLFCTNDMCPAKATSRVAHFFKTLGAEGVADKTIETLEIETIDAAYDLTVTMIQRVRGFRDAKARNFHDAIRNCLKDVPESKLLEAFGIPHIGKEKAKAITATKSIDEIFAPGFSFKTLDIPGIGPTCVGQLQLFQDEGRRLLALLRIKGLVTVKETVAAEASTLSGKVFVLTGTGPKTRETYVAEIKRLGGGYSDTVTLKVTHLVTDGAASTKGNKVDEINKKGKKHIAIMSYKEFEALLEKSKTEAEEVEHVIAGPSTQ